MAYNDPATTFEKQREILKARGLLIENDSDVDAALRNIGYYRFSGYHYHLRSNDIFFDDVSFTQIHSIYNFSSELSALLYPMLSQSELRARVMIAYHSAHDLGPLGYQDVCNFPKLQHCIFDKPTVDLCLNCSSKNKCKRYIHGLFMNSANHSAKNNKEPYRVHYSAHYNDNFPIWVLVQSMTYGTLSQLYSSLPEDLQKTISSNYNGRGGNEVLGRWFRVSSALRNIVAHYGRLYNRPLLIKAPIPHNISKNTKKFGEVLKIKPDSLFTHILIHHALCDGESWKTFCSKLISLINNYEKYINLDLIGFPENWEKIIRISMV